MSYDFLKVYSIYKKKKEILLSLDYAWAETWGQGPCGFLLSGRRWCEWAWTGNKAHVAFLLSGELGLAMLGPSGLFATRGRAAAAWRRAWCGAAVCAGRPWRRRTKRTRRATAAVQPEGEKKGARSHPATKWLADDDAPRTMAGGEGGSGVHDGGVVAACGCSVRRGHAARG